MLIVKQEKKKKNVYICGDPVGLLDKTFHHSGHGAFKLVHKDNAEAITYSYALIVDGHKSKEKNMCPLTVTE